MSNHIPNQVPVSLNRRTLGKAGLASAMLMTMSGFGATAFARQATPAAGSAQSPAAAAVAAWIYGYPLITMQITADVSTNVTKPESPRAPWNQIVSLREFPDASFTTVVAPNVDTLYSSAFINLADGPVVLSWPAMPDRYFVMPILSGWTDVEGSYGSRTTGQDAATVLISGPGWDGAIPAGVTLPENTIKLELSTALGWLIGRVYCDGSAEDLDKVHAIQDQITLAPLANYGAAYTPPAGVVRDSVDMATAPVAQVNHMSGKDYFTLLASLLEANPPRADDAPMVETLASLGIVAGQPFAYDTLDPEVRQAIDNAPGPGLTLLPTIHIEGPYDGSNWQVPLGLGQYGVDYQLRAYVTLIGLGANLSEDAVYPAAFTDTNHERLDGTSNYVVHFSELPPVKGFWSLTAYTSEQFLVPNPINRYAIRGANKLTFNADGSLDLYVQASSPGADKESNWLPVPAADFVLMLRLYWPDESVLKGTWQLPTVEKD